MQRICEDRMDAFGTSGQASSIKPINLEEMVLRYDSGELNQVVK